MSKRDRKRASWFSTTPQETSLMRTEPKRPCVRVHESTMVHIKVQYGGMLLECAECVVDYSGGETLFINNVDPRRMELARILQLVVKELPEGVKKPSRVWYREQRTPRPMCIKPLHTATHLRQMFSNMVLADSNWGFIYFQSEDNVMSGSGDFDYVLPHPLSYVKEFEGMENLYEHATLIQATQDLLTPQQLGRIQRERRPTVSFD